jgi:hypothetical protein
MRIAETIKTNDNLHLTDQEIAAREALMEEIEAIEQNLEAIKQEHGLDQASTIERAGVSFGGVPAPVFAGWGG